MKIHGITSVFYPIKQNKKNFKSINKNNLTSWQNSRFLGTNKDIIETSEQNTCAIDTIHSANTINVGSKSGNNEYYRANFGTYKKLTDGFITAKRIKNADRLFYLFKLGDQYNSILFNGYIKHFASDGIVIETYYDDGYISMINTYKNGKMCKGELFNPNSHKKECVKKFDGPFIMTQSYQPSGTRVDILTRNQDSREKLKVYFYASNGRDYESSCKTFQITNGNKSTICGINWGSEKKTIMISDSKECNKKLKNALEFIQKTVQSPKYTEDFGRNEKLNLQLSEIISYLDNETQ